MWKQYSVNYFPWNEDVMKGSTDQGTWSESLGTFVGAPKAFVKDSTLMAGTSVNTPVFQRIQKPVVRSWNDRTVPTVPVTTGPTVPFRLTGRQKQRMSKTELDELSEGYKLNRGQVAIEDTLFLNSSRTKGERLCKKLSHYHGHLILHGHGDNTRDNLGGMLLKGRTTRTVTQVYSALDKLWSWCTDPRSMSFFVYFVNCHSGELYGVATRAMLWFQTQPIYPLGVYGASGEIQTSSLQGGGLFSAKFIGKGVTGWKTLRGPDFAVVKRKIAVVQKGYGGRIRMQGLGFDLG